MTKDWIKFKKSFTEEQRDALWQYIIDHSMIQPNGYHGIQFYIRNEDDFWERVNSRYTLEYFRYNKLEKQNEAERQAERFAEKLGRNTTKKIQKIDEGNKLFDKIVLYIYRKSRDYILK